MSETVERNNRFYEQSNGEMLTENEQLKEWLKIANKSNEELQKERDMYKDSFETMSTNYFRLENIIKEARKKLVNLNDKFKTISGIPFNVSEIVEMIEMLDKEVN